MDAKLPPGLYGRPGIRKIDGATLDAVDCLSGDGDCLFPGCRCAPLKRPAQPEGVQAWRPIETAPKEQVLLLAAEFDRRGDWRMKCGYYTVETGWRVWGASWAPTMWRPMPEPPAPQSTDDKTHG